MCVPFHVKEEPSALALAAPAQGAAAAGSDEALPRRGRPDRETTVRRDRAIRAHLTANEQIWAKTQVNEEGLLLADVIDGELARTERDGGHLSPKFWTRVLDEFGFGKGEWDRLRDDSNPNQIVSVELDEGIQECYHPNPAKRKCKILLGFLESADGLTRKDMRWLWCKAVEQRGLMRCLSDQMLMAIGDYITRTSGYRPANYFTVWGF